MNRFERTIAAGTMLAAAAAGCSETAPEPPESLREPTPESSESHILEFNSKPSEQNFTVGFDCKQHPEILGGLDDNGSAPDVEQLTITLGTRSSGGVNPPGTPEGAYQNAIIGTGATIQPLGDFSYDLALSDGSVEEDIQLDESFQNLEGKPVEGFERHLETEDSGIYIRIIGYMGHIAGESLMHFEVECVDEDKEPLVPSPENTPQEV